MVLSGRIYCTQYADYITTIYTREKLKMILRLTDMNGQRLIIDTAVCEILFLRQLSPAGGTQLQTARFYINVADSIDDVSAQLFGDPEPIEDPGNGLPYYNDDTCTYCNKKSTTEYGDIKVCDTCYAAKVNEDNQSSQYDDYNEPYR